jgi:hypothetical protein
MRKRAMLLGLFGLGLFGLAGPANAEEPDRSRDRVRGLRRQLMDLEAIGRARVFQERGVKPPRRPAVNTASNLESFEAVTARFVRFTVTATVNGAEPCLHTLEITGPDSPANLTGGARLTASSIWPGHLGDFKDGKYVPGWFWVSRERGAGWLRVELPAPARIARVVWSRDAAGRHHDRIPSAYKVEVSGDGRAWQTVATGEDRAVPGRDYWISRSAMVKALDPGQRKRHQGLLDELRKLGVPRPNEVKSGPQVGENVNGAFAALFLNGEQRHVGKQRCPV